MAKAATIKKPAPAAAAKPVALKKPAAAPAAKPAAKPAAAKAKPPAKPAKPFEDRDIVIFKGYAPVIGEDGKETPADLSDKIFTPEQELAVVSERQDENGRTFVACVAVGDYHKYQADNDSVNGEELMPSEIKRTNKKVEDEYALTLVGNMETILSEDADPLNVAIALYNRASESFFYFGGVLSKLTKERDENGDPLFATYDRGDGQPYGKEGYEQFLIDNFGDTFGKRKADYYISIYETFSALPNAEEIVKQLPAVGWSKAGKMANYVTEENAAELVQLAQEQSEVKLLETLKTQYTTEGGLNAKGKSASHTTIKRTTFGPYKLFEDVGAAVEMIITAAAKQTGIQDPAALFEHIVTEWASDHLGEVAQKAKVAGERHLEKLKKAGVKLPDNHPGAAPKTEAKAAAPAAKPAAAKPAAAPAKAPVKTIAKR